MTPPRAPRKGPDGTTSWRPQDIQDHADFADDLLREIAAALPETMARVSEWTPSGIPTSGGGERVAGGNRNDDGTKPGVLEMTLRNPHDVTDPNILSMHVIIHGLVRIATAADKIKKAVAQLTAIDPLATEAVFKIRVPAGVGTCSNPHCRRECNGGKDRLRSGRCNTCRVYRDDHHGEERPHRLCHDTPVGGCDECARLASCPQTA